MSSCTFEPEQCAITLQNWPNRASSIYIHLLSLFFCAAQMGNLMGLSIKQAKDDPNDKA